MSVVIIIIFIIAVIIIVAVIVIDRFLVLNYGDVNKWNVFLVDSGRFNIFSIKLYSFMS